MKIVYDLRHQPFSVGDILMYQQVSLILTDEPIDFVVSVDPENPTVKDKHLKHINKNNLTQHLAWLLPAARVNPHLRSMTLLPHKETGDWPKTRFCPISHYMYYDCMDIIKKCFHGQGFIPTLKCLPEVESQADDFLFDHGRTTVQLRRNPHWIERNSDYDVWLRFFERNHCENFIVVCAPHEVDDRLRLKNVTFASDFFGQDTEMICALIEGADIHMGVNSGPACMKMFGKKPFCLFKDGTSTLRTPGLHKSGDGIKFDWNTDKQTMLPFAETVERIELEFDRMKCS